MFAQGIFEKVMIEAGADLTARVVEIIDWAHVENVVANDTTSDAIYTVCVALKWLLGASVLGQDSVSGPRLVEGVPC